MRELGRRSREAIAHLCWNDANPDPRVLQVAFTTMLLGSMTIRVLPIHPTELAS